MHYLVSFSAFFNHLNEEKRELVALFYLSPWFSLLFVFYGPCDNVHNPFFTMPGAVCYCGIS